MATVSLADAIILILKESGASRLEILEAMMEVTDRLKDQLKTQAHKEKQVIRKYETRTDLKREN